MKLSVTKLKQELNFYMLAFKLAKSTSLEPGPNVDKMKWDIYFELFTVCM